MGSKTSFTFSLTPPQQQQLVTLLRRGNYRLVHAPHAVIAAETPDCRITLFQSGKCLVQGKAAEDWVLYTLEPTILRKPQLGYEGVWDPGRVQPHIGVDESGKGDFFGPLVIAAAYVDPQLTERLQKLNVRDSKTISSDRVAKDLAADIRKALGRKFTIVKIGPRAYNSLYAKIRNVNRILAWGHARAIENLLEVEPNCPRALSDQFGPREQIMAALMSKGRSIQLEQRPRAEADPAVAAASILARAAFLDSLDQLSKKYGVTLPKGASDQVKTAAIELVKRHGPTILLETAKCHFKTTEIVLAELGLTREALGKDGEAVSKPRTPAGGSAVRRKSVT